MSSTTTNDAALELENMEDQRDAADALVAAMLGVCDETVPWVLCKRLSHDDNPVVVWREYRGLSQAELATAAALTLSELATIEAGHTDPGLCTMARVASGLRIDVDDLVPPTQD